MKTVALVQARMGSSRLPGKVLRPLLGRPMLSHVVHRLREARTLDQIVVATSSAPQDRQIVDFCRGQAVKWFCGSEQDVLDRFYQAALAFQADTIVRVTADCPLIDPGVVDRVVSAYRARCRETDHASNVLPHRTFPRGLDTEVFGGDLLERLWIEDQNPRWRQHVTEMVFQQPERFRILNICNETDLSHHRWTVDTAADLELVQRIFQFFGPRPFSWRDVLAVTAQHPEWLELNRHVRQKAV